MTVTPTSDGKGPLTISTLEAQARLWPLAPLLHSMAMPTPPQQGRFEGGPS